MSTDNGFALLETSCGHELVTARVNGSEITIGINAKCGHAVLESCVAQANRVPVLLAALDQINVAACYASEEDTGARAAALLHIGELARAAIKAA